MAYSSTRAFPAALVFAPYDGPARAGVAAQTAEASGHPLRETARSPGTKGQAAASPAAMQSLDVIDMESELGYWRSHYRGLSRCDGLRYSDYEPALKLGLDAYMRGHGRSIGDMEQELRDCYRRTRGGSRLDWDQAHSVVQAAWDRLNDRGGR